MSHLWLSERVRHQSAAATAQLVLATMREAQAQLAERVTAETVATYGSDSPATLAIVASIERRLRAGSGGSVAAS
jgi:phenylpyruvate tautomerase PptA (4-oxalocrotonate tautomerase family)